MARYRKKPVEVEAIQWTGNNLKEVLEFSDKSYIDKDNYTLKIDTLEGTHIASRGDYIIKGIKGEFYPCKPDIFEATYEMTYNLEDITTVEIKDDKGKVIAKIEER